MLQEWPAGGNYELLGCGSFDFSVGLGLHFRGFGGGNGFVGVGFHFFLGQFFVSFDGRFMGFGVGFRGFLVGLGLRLHFVFRVGVNHVVVCLGFGLGGLVAGVSFLFVSLGLCLGDVFVSVGRYLDRKSVV